MTTTITNNCGTGTCETEYVPPAVNIREEKDAYVLEADMPGVKPDGLTIDLRDNVLTIEGRVPETEGRGYLLQEYETGSFRREFRLTNLIDQGGIDATMRDGVLRLRQPRKS